MADHSAAFGLALSPSGAARWTECPASAILGAGAGHHETPYTRAGTLGHELAALRWERILTGRARLGIEKRIREELDAPGSARSWVDTETAVMTWIEWVNALAPEHKRQDRFSEYRLYGDELFPGLHGTADYIARLYDGDEPAGLVVSDLKLGSGVRVNAEQNLQLYLYAWMALSEFTRAPVPVVLHIGQPFLPNGSSVVRTTADEVRALVDARVRPALARLREQLLHGAYGDPGPHCRWCPAAATCRARRDEWFGLDGRPARDLTADELADLVGRVKDIRAWADAIESRAFEMLSDGPGLPGWALEAGPARRTVPDLTSAVERFENVGVPAERVTTKKLKSLKELTKEVPEGLSLEDVLGDTMRLQPGRARLIREDEHVKRLFGEGEEE